MTVHTVSSWGADRLLGSMTDAQWHAAHDERPVSIGDAYKAAARMKSNSAGAFQTIATYGRLRPDPHRHALKTGAKRPSY